MPKYFNKKILSLFCVIIALTQFDFILTMSAERPTKQRKISSPALPTGTKITDLPLDCLHVIVEFYEKNNKIKKSAKLRLVCKDFKKAVSRRTLFYTINCEKPKDITYLSLFGSVKGLALKYANFNSPKKKEKEWLEKLPNLQKLSLNHCNKFPGLKLRQLKQLSVENSTFTGAELEAPKLEKLLLTSCGKFTCIKQGKVPNLQYLSVNSCKNFTWTGLEKLPKLKKLIVTEPYKELDFLSISFEEDKAHLKNESDLNIFEKLKKNGCTVIHQTTPQLWKKMLLSKTKAKKIEKVKNHE